MIAEAAWVRDQIRRGIEHRHRAAGQPVDGRQLTRGHHRTVGDHHIMITADKTAGVCRQVGAGILHGAVGDRAGGVAADGIELRHARARAKNPRTADRRWRFLDQHRLVAADEAARARDQIVDDPGDRHRARGLRRDLGNLCRRCRGTARGDDHVLVAVHPAAHVVHQGHCRVHDHGRRYCPGRLGRNCAQRRQRRPLKLARRQTGHDRNVHVPRDVVLRVRNNVKERVRDRRIGHAIAVLACRAHHRELREGRRIGDVEVNTTVKRADGGDRGQYIRGRVLNGGKANDARGHECIDGNGLGGRGTAHEIHGHIARHIVTVVVDEIRRVIDNRGVCERAVTIRGIDRRQLADRRCTGDGDVGSWNDVRIGCAVRYQLRRDIRYLTVDEKPTAVGGVDDSEIGDTDRTYDGDIGPRCDGWVCDTVRNEIRSRIGDRTHKLPPRAAGLRNTLQGAQAL